MEHNLLAEIRMFNIELKKSVMPNPQVLPIDSASQFQVLKVVLLSETEVFQKQIEEQLHLKKATVSGILDTLEKRKLIVRVKSEADARKNIIKPNYEILPRKEDLIALEHQANAFLTSCVEPEKLEVFYEVLGVLTEKVKDGMKGGNNA